MAERYICALCGEECVSAPLHSKYWREVKVYLERGISKKNFLCKKCYEAKIDVCNYGNNTNDRKNAIELFNKYVSNKTDMVKNIVNSWINGELINYYDNLNDLVYYVPGPIESLYVFKNHLTILSMFEDCQYSKPWDCVMFFNRENSDGSHRKKLFVELNDNNGSDIDTLKAEGILLDDSCSDMILELNKSIGDYGELYFRSQHSTEHRFSFFYHQNQLMEEVYNYINKRVENSDAEEEEIEQTVANVQKVSSKSVVNKSEQVAVTYSPADEIKKMKELLDIGIISSEDFERAKNKLIDKL